MKPVIIAIAITLTILIAEYNIVRCYPLPAYNPGHVASEKVKAAMRYHGIRFAESDAEGKLWFVRDGHRCRLFTKEFLKKWGG